VTDALLAGGGEATAHWQRRVDRAATSHKCCLKPIASIVQGDQEDDSEVEAPDTKQHVSGRLIIQVSANHIVGG